MSDLKNNYVVLAFYYFTPIENPQLEIKKHLAFFKGRDVTSRIYINEKGFNGQMSASLEDGEAYIAWMHADERFKDIVFKKHFHPEQAFPKLTVKYRKQLVAVDMDLDPADGGEHVSPARWKEMLEDDEDYTLIDVRNDYEWKVGHFEGAELPECRTFRDFEQYTQELSAKVDPKKTKVMMYCTGGIRCELYSVLMKNRGFKDVYQLDGGVINYGLKEGGKHWNGKLFVFDDRLTVPISDEKTPVIGKCHDCGCAIEDYYNCANMDCNELFLSCRECLKAQEGCCLDCHPKECEKNGRLRPYQDQNPHKPFRRVPKEDKSQKKKRFRWLGDSCEQGFLSG